MMDRTRPRTGLLAAFAGGLCLGWGLGLQLPEALPAWAPLTVGLALLSWGLFLVWPRQAEKERILREAEELLVRRRARNPREREHEAAKPGRASPNSPGVIGRSSGNVTPTSEMAAIRHRLRDVTREIQQAAVRLGLNQLSKEGYTARVRELQTSRADLEARLIELERQAIERP